MAQLEDSPVHRQQDRPRELPAGNEGQIVLDGQVVQFDSPRRAIARGIGMVHQHFMLVPPLTVAENLTLGAESTFGPGILDLDRVRDSVRDLSASYGLPVDPDALVRDLPVGIQQRVEILKALYRQARVLILDEPTAVLTPQETRRLFDVLRSLQQQGKTIVLITHKLQEVKSVSRNITVMRRGEAIVSDGKLTAKPGSGAWLPRAGGAAAAPQQRLTADMDPARNFGAKLL